jgi:hypothetical protein
MTLRRKASHKTSTPVIQRAAGGQWVTMGAHIIRSLGGADAAKAAVAVVVHRVSNAALEEPDTVKSIRANPAETLLLLSGIALFHSQIPDVRAFIEERLAEKPRGSTARASSNRRGMCAGSRSDADLL